MSENRPPNPPSRGKPNEAWRVERMVQPVPGHLGEESRFSPWLIVIAVAVIVLVGALLLLFNQAPSAGSVSTGPTVASATAKPRTTIIRITATPQPTKPPTVPPTVALLKYTVVKGDTLSKIAQKFKVSVEAIRAANDLTDDTIREGDVLTIPQATPTPPALSNASGGAETEAPTSTPLVFRTPTLIAFAQSPTQVTPTTPTPTPGVVNYTVKAGDNLLSIAGVFSTTVQAIIDLNKLESDSIRAGQTLTVPVGIWIPTSTPTVFVTPTATPTAEFAFAAPDLIFPSDGADFARGAAVTVQWLSPGALEPDEYYVVHLSYLQDGVEQDLPGYEVSEGTSLTLDAPPVGATPPIQFWWYVVVVKGSGCGVASPAAVQPCAVSPVSEKRTFTWR